MTRRKVVSSREWHRAEIKLHILQLIHHILFFLKISKNFQKYLLKKLSSICIASYSCHMLAYEKRLFHTTDPLPASTVWAIVVGFKSNSKKTIMENWKNYCHLFRNPKYEHRLSTSKVAAYAISDQKSHLDLTRIADSNQLPLNLEVLGKD